MNTMQTKICTKCGIEKPTDQFHAHKKAKDGLKPRCKSCRAEYGKQYFQSNKVAVCGRQKVYNDANKAKIAIRGKAYQQANKIVIAGKRKVWVQANKVSTAEYMKAYQQANKARTAVHKKVYCQANKAKIAERMKAYNQSNPEKRRAIKANYRARKLGNGGSHTSSDIKALFVLQKGKCICCKTSLKDGYHVDHIYPVSKEGRNDKYNLQLLCQPCNQSKSARHPVDFMQQRGFLL